MQVIWSGPQAEHQPEEKTMISRHGPAERCLQKKPFSYSLLFTKDRANCSLALAALVYILQGLGSALYF